LAKVLRKQRQHETEENIVKEKVVLAYSGGLDTSVLVRILQEPPYNYEVVCCHVDVGEARDTQAIVRRAKKAGAIACEVVDAKEEFAKDYCFRALKANALYEGVYPLSAALSRPLITKYLVDAAKKHGATAVAHGSTGKGNDQVRFDLGARGLAPELKIIVPQRERNLSRDVAMEYAEKYGIEVPTTKKSPYSIDENLWGRSIEGGILENPMQEPPEDAFAWTKSLKEAPGEPGYICIGFEEGIPVSVDGQRMSPAALIEKCNAFAGLHGVGRIDLMENRVVGIKSRENYECPGATLLIRAHQDLERFTTLGLSLRLKAIVDQKFAEMVYEGFWFSPYREAMDAFNDSCNKVVSGEVRLRLFKSSCQVVGRNSPHGLYNHALSTYDKEDSFDHRASEGFIELLGLPLTLFSRIHRK